MSLYDDVARSMANSRSVTASASGILDGIVGGAKSAISNTLGGGKLGQAVATIGTGMAKNAAMGMVNKLVPPGQVRNITTGIGIAGSLMQGDFESAGMRLLDSGLLRNILPGMDGVASQTLYWGSPTPLLGGITPAEAKRIHDEIRATKFAKKNLFLIEVSSELFGKDLWDFDRFGKYWVFDRFNLFVTDVSYAPITISGEKMKIGAAAVDVVNSSDPIEMRIVTKDDAEGNIRRWFAAHSATAAHDDGTVGVPAQYAIRIRIVHAFITRESNRGGYEDVGLFRPANIEVDLSRRDDNLEEIQMTFSQLDTFMAP